MGDFNAGGAINALAGIAKASEKLPTSPAPSQEKPTGDRSPAHTRSTSAPAPAPRGAPVRPGVHPEGRFFPDTYTYVKGSTDVHLLQRALRAMDKRLNDAWAQKASDTP